MKSIRRNIKSTINKLCLPIVVAGLVSGCTATVTPDGAVVASAAPVVVVAPDFYAWDGVEYVGEVNGTYMYLNPGGVWVACDPVRLERFHAWVGVHPDWRRSAIRYDHAHRPDPRGMRAPPAREGERRDER